MGIYGEHLAALSDDVLEACRHADFKDQFNWDGTVDQFRSRRIA